MSYNQKPPGSSGSGMGGGPPNGPNNMPQVAKTFAGIQQQMQNLVHGQNAIPQSSQADINAFLQQQRIQNMLKQQQQFLQFQHQMQQQQHQQQQHQHHNMAGGGGVGPGSVAGVPSVGGVAGPSGGSAAGGGEPLALTRTAGAAELLNKTYQQQANGNPTGNPTFNQLQQTLQALPTNFVQQLQVFQYQMQAKQMQQQQHGGGQGQHGHGQQQPVQGVPPTSSATAVMGHQQQQQQQQKHQNQQQQQQNALSRYLTAAAAQAAAASGNKMSSATPPPPPPLTNQMKPPNLPPNTQITPVTAGNIAGGNISAGTNPKISTGNTNTVSAKHSAPPPSISLTPSKPSTSGPSIAHQQNKFTPPTNSGVKGGHMSHSQNLPKSTHGATHSAASNTTSPAKTGTNSDATVAALKSPQSTPVQLTKQMSPTTTTAAAMGNKTPTNTQTTTAATSIMVSPLKSTTTATPPTAVVANTLTTSAAVGPNITTSITSVTTNTISTKPTSGTASKATLDEITTSKLPLKSANTEKETAKLSSNDTFTPATVSSAAAPTDDDKKEVEKPKEKKLETATSLAVTATGAAVNKTTPLAIETKKDLLQKADNGLKTNSATTTPTSNTESTAASSAVQSKRKEEKMENSTKSNKLDNHDATDSEKKLNTKKAEEKNEPTTTNEKNGTLSSTSTQPTTKQKLGSTISDDKKSTAELKQIKNSEEENKLECKEKTSEKEKEKEKEKDKTMKSNKSSNKVDQVEAVASKELKKPEKEAEKSISCVEAKSTPAATTTAQTISIKTSVKVKVDDNIKNSMETNNTKGTLESEQNKKDDKLPVTDVSETDVAKLPKADTQKESKIATALKENEESLKPSKLTEKPEATKTAKSVLPQSVNKAKTEDKDKDTNAAAQKEMVSVAVITPAKKVGRLAKGAKSRSAASSTPTASKSTEIQDDKPAASSARAKRKPKPDNVITVDSAPSTPKDEDLDRKSKRHRLKTILYQSPLPELAYITKLSASEASNSPKPMSNEDRLIVFYKNEYMAVRNAEGTFYLCQTMQNVYRTSPRISIRWLSEDAKDNSVFIPDFYDHTDIECVLTTVELKRIDKGHLRLPKGERNRIESILKKAIDVEKGLVPRPELTEENPDGLDISLFKDESQIEKKSALADGSENQTLSVTPGRKLRRGNTSTALSGRKSIAASATPSTSAGNKRKPNAASAATSSSSSRKSLTKKRKTLLKRKKKLNNSDEEDDDDETSDDCESDAEYKPTQKRASLNVSGVSRSAPRAQRSPLAKARAASPITPTTSRSNKNVPQKTTPTPSTSKVSRGERAAKRKSIIDVGPSEEAKKPMTITSSSKSKVSDKHASEATPVKKSSLIDNSSASSSNSSS